MLEETFVQGSTPAASTIRLGRDAAEADGALSEPQRAEGESKGRLRPSLMASHCERVRENALSERSESTGFILQASAKQLDFDSRW